MRAMVVLIAARGQWEFTGMFERAGIPHVAAGPDSSAATLVTASFAVPGLEVARPDRRRARRS